MGRLIERFVAANRHACRAIDRWLPARFSIDGNRHFADVIVPRYARTGACVVDVGGGRSPFFSAERKTVLGLFVVGMDIAEVELSRAPLGTYDAAVVGDICDPPLAMEADLAVCMTVIEHVRSASRAVEGMARLVRTGGTVAVFAPGRYAPFALLNVVVPEWLKRRMLRALYPRMHESIGFPAYYDQCTPSALARVAERAGFRVVEMEIYNWSGYFDFFVPFYVCWRLVSMAAVRLFGADACDRFCLVMVRAG